MLPLPALRMAHPGGARPPFADDRFHREASRGCGVEPVRRVLPLAPSTYHAHAAVARDPGKASDRSKKDAETLATIRSVHDESGGRSGAPKVWRQLRREDGGPARKSLRLLSTPENHSSPGALECLNGAMIRCLLTPARPCPQDKVNRQFKADAPDQLRVADFTYVHTAMGMACAAFVIDIFARKIVGWRIPTSMTTSFVLDALNQAICQRRPVLGV